MSFFEFLSSPSMLFFILFGASFLTALLTNRLLDDISKKKIEQYANIAFYIALIFWIFFAIQIGSVSGESAITAFFLGSTIFLFVWGASWIYRAFSRLEGAFPFSSYLAASFGGGNRGIIVVSLLSLFSENMASNVELLSYFIFVDQGYFWTLLLFGLFIMRLDFSTSAKRQLPFSRIEKLTTGSVISAIIVTFLIRETSLFDTESSQVLEYLRTISGTTLLCTATFTMFLRSFESKSRVNESLLSKARVVVYASRATGFVLLIGVVALVRAGLDMPIDIGLLFFEQDGTPNYIIWAACILLVCPPSSLIDDFIKSVGGPDSQSQAAAAISARMNLNFIKVLLVLFVAAVVVKGSGVVFPGL